MSIDLSPEDFDFLEDILLRSDSDDAILSVSELDGFLTAVVSGPDLIMPSTWLPAVWGGEENAPVWESETELKRFMSIVMLMMNSNVAALMEVPETFEALFFVNENIEPPVFIVDEWCFGYMRGVRLGHWENLTEEMAVHLDAIGLHGLEENFPLVTELTLEEHRTSVAKIEPAVRKLHQYWLSQRAHLAPGHSLASNPRPMSNVVPFIRPQPKIGPNQPCPCGSGKKYKKCCGAH